MSKTFPVTCNKIGNRKSSNDATEL